MFAVGLVVILTAIYLISRLTKGIVLENRREQEIVTESVSKSVDFGVGTGIKFGFGFAIGVALASLIFGLISMVAFASFIENMMGQNI